MNEKQTMFLFRQSYITDDAPIGLLYDARMTRLENGKFSVVNWGEPPKLYKMRTKENAFSNNCLPSGQKEIRTKNTKNNIEPE